MFDDDLEQHYAYLKGSRQDPQPWDDQNGPQTTPMAALTPDVLEKLDQRVAPAVPEPQRSVQPHLTRMQERRTLRSRRRWFCVKLAVGFALVFAGCFLLAMR